MIILAVIFLTGTVYSGIRLFIEYRKTNAVKASEIIDFACDICLGGFLLLTGLALKNIITYNWFTSNILIILYFAGKLLKKKLQK